MLDLMKSDDSGYVLLSHSQKFKSMSQRTVGGKAPLLKNESEPISVSVRNAEVMLQTFDRQTFWSAMAATESEEEDND